MLFPKLLSVYVLVCPIDGKYRYVGLTSQPLDHRRHAHWVARHRHTSCRDWFLSLEGLGLFPGILQVCETYDPGMEEVWHSRLIEEGHPILNRYTKLVPMKKGQQRLQKGAGKRIQYVEVETGPVASFDEPKAPTQGSYNRVKRWRKAHPERHLEIKARYTARSKGRRAAYFKWWTGERRKKRKAQREAERAKTPPGGI